jgi:hypothetical protein
VTKGPFLWTIDGATGTKVYIIFVIGSAN